ncbi:tRNA uridine-5-carboxymethylaminomethyl(34) synthesis GTPase MnmE [Blattabacterium cuenoti]|uniref:tRNA uridine-5-carboxymethylaminomethyl(34) synthesis GTPase MnmE n=1 Tax=Blattabacterium cuenoti TaxID=1653831 RepID=UPI00163CD534|nr:tRNA uridine-5-carboxymethylaminomethyl(34) synthesis GTPase MnmE [Blattabacterium cuenoti]
MFLKENDTIIASATPYGPSAISIIRISGKNSISIVDSVFSSIKNGKKLLKQSTHTIHLGFIKDKSFNTKGKVFDQVLVSIFKSPFSYTGENMIEISCHGSSYIQKNIIKLLINKGMRLARSGEFTLRAFLNKKLDLTQAEAISELISSENESCNDINIQHIKGHLSKEIKNIKKKLIDFISILELELDFSEEHLISYNNNCMMYDLKNIKKKLQYIVESFSLGNSIKNGINVVIIGDTNVGKSTLFNQIIKESRSIVSPVQGTTRDCIEGTIILDGILFRFIDTAGLRKSNNSIEIMGINKTIEKIEDSQVILYVFDSSISSEDEKQKKIFNNIYFFSKKYTKKIIFTIANKSDISNFYDIQNFKSNMSYFFEISAKNCNGIKKILNTLSRIFIKKLENSKIIITQIRHYEALKKSLEEILISFDIFNKNPSEYLIISMHIKNSLKYLEEITGEITNDDILNNIFSKFCIGK